LPHWRQLFTREALRDLVPVLLRNRLPVRGWRLDSASDNPEFLLAVRSSQLAPSYSDRSYIARAVIAGAKAWLAPQSAANNWILQGTADQVVSPLSARLLTRRISRPRAECTLLHGVQHGVLWDRDVGEDVARQVVDYVLAAF
jgi:alpha-beta hydrolase superfamily lysophospholipase